MENKQGPTVEHGEVCSVLWGSLDWRGVWGRMGTCICMAESLHCSPETITTLLIGYMPVQNKKLKKNKERLSHLNKQLIPKCKRINRNPLHAEGA